ncbi:hypothetical protein ACFLZ6_01345 [Nanoarchaeota archaeon]
MKENKAQVTLFIIVGLVIVILVGIVYSVTKSAKDAETRAETTKTEEVRFETQPVQVFVENCLDKAIKEGLILLGNQGGRLTKEQGGTLSRFRNINNVSYAIYPPSPFIEDPYSLGLYGDNNLPPLTREGSQSMQLQLERFVVNEMDKCNLSTFESQAIKINKGTPIADATLAKDNVDVRLTYQLDVESIATGAKTTLKDFRKSKKVRLGRIYELVSDLITLETTNASFNIASPVNFRDGMSIIVQRDAFENDDTIIITDPGSLIDGVPYRFKFSRYNRKPATYPIVPVVSFDEFDDEDLIYPENISTEPKADDPDEDFPITVFYRLITPTEAVQETDFGNFLIDQAGNIMSGTSGQGVRIVCPFSTVQICTKEQAKEPYCLDLEPAIC